MKYNVAEIRSHFPSLQDGTVFFDNPGGTQVPQEVIDAVSDYYRTANANTHGAFETSQRTDRVISTARAAFADLINARSPDEIIFGPNMTTLTFHVARALGRSLHEGDEVMVTRLDHDANIAPWLALGERGVLVKWVDIHTDDCTLDLADFERQLSTKTRIVAVSGASNAVGSVNDLKTLVPLAHMAGARVFVDAVHYAPHAPIDVQDWDCDLLVCSAYKFYGPHLGVLYGKHELLDRLVPDKVRPSSPHAPEKFETGTQSHEAIAGAHAAVNYLAALGEEYGGNFSSSYQGFTGRRLHLKTALAAIQMYERELFTRLMQGLAQTLGVEIYGIRDAGRFAYRAPTVAFNVDGHTPRVLAERFAKENIYVWDGNYYALALMERLGLEGKGGAVRVGLAHYNTREEVDHFLNVLHKVAQ